MIRVIQYSINNERAWNDFLAVAKNQTFMFCRHFMDYHKDRFADYSLMVYDIDELVALVPAHTDQAANDTVYSHNGLSYGGVVLKKDVRALKALDYLRHILEFLARNGKTKFFLKQFPAFYNEIPGDEIEYAMFLLGAKNYRTDIAAVVTMGRRLPYQERRIRSIKKARKLNVRVIEEHEFSGFWNRVLVPNLQARFGVAPVHSIKEITALFVNNPGCIRQFNAYNGEELLAGCTIFESPTTAHAQYISANDEGRRNGALDLLFDELINTWFAHKTFFDFGIVNENGGTVINHGLLDWKEGFGARSYAHRFYEIDTASHTALARVVAEDH